MWSLVTARRCLLLRVLHLKVLEVQFHVLFEEVEIVKVGFLTSRVPCGIDLVNLGAPVHVVADFFIEGERSSEGVELFAGPLGLLWSILRQPCALEGWLSHVETGFLFSSRERLRGFFGERSEAVGYNDRGGDQVDPGTRATFARALLLVGRFDPGT